MKGGQAASLRRSSGGLFGTLPKMGRALTRPPSSGETGEGERERTNYQLSVIPQYSTYYTLFEVYYPKDQMNHKIGAVPYPIQLPNLFFVSFV